MVEGLIFGRDLVGRYRINGVQVLIAVLIMVLWGGVCAAQVQVGTTATVVGTGDPAQRKVFSTVGGEQWVFWFDGAQIQYRRSADGVTWGGGGSLAYSTDDYSVQYRSASGVDYIVVAIRDGFDVVVLRGIGSGGAITFDSPVVVFDGTAATDAYQNPSVSVSGNGTVWVAAVYLLADYLSNPEHKQVVARRSINTIEASISSLAAVQRVGRPDSGIRTVVLLPRIGDEMYLIVNGASQNISGYLFDGSSWINATTGGAGGWFTFPSAAFNGRVLAVTGRDNLVYAGGQFTVAGGVEASAIAMWNGATWSSLGSGVWPYVSALSSSGSMLYAGGFLFSAGGDGVNHVAAWDGTTWSSLGSGVNTYRVRALTMMGTTLYAGGDFTDAGGTAVNYVAAWNGVTWSPLGTGVNGSVYALAATASRLYVGGWFTTASGGSANRIAAWDGTAWSTLGTGMDNIVSGLALSGTILYAAGWFNAADGSPAYHVAAWNGATWANLGVGTWGSWPAAASLVFSGSLLYAGGSGSQTTAVWNGTTWSPLASGVNNAVYAMTFVGGSLSVGGEFSTAGGSVGSYFASWNGTRWDHPGTGGGLNGNLLTLTFSGSVLYAGGRFSTIGGTTARQVAMWSGTTWSSMGLGIGANDPRVLAAAGTFVYVGGQFWSGGGAPGADHIAAWNGATWSALGTGMDVNATVLALAPSGSLLYAAGTFTSAGGTSANYVASWDGVTWRALGAGLNNAAYCLTVSGSILYAGGFFTDAGGTSANRIAAWNGATWSALGVGLDDDGVFALAESGGLLYVAGGFNSIGGSTVQKIAVWDGQTWIKIGDLTGYRVYALSIINSKLYVGGDVLGANAVSFTRIGVWDGSTWGALGAGLDAAPGAFAVANNLLYVGGHFKTADAKFSPHFALYGSAIATNVGTDSSISAAPGTGGDVHLAYQDASRAIRYRRFSASTWGSTVTLDASAASGRPTLSLDSSSNTLYSVYSQGTNLLYTKSLSLPSSWTAPSPFTGSNVNFLPIATEQYAGAYPLNVVWLQGASSPYAAVLAPLNTPTPTATPTVTPTVTITPTATQTPTPTPTTETGSGLQAEYFDNIDFTDLKLTRVDQSVNFNWGAGSPDPSMQPDTFSIRWSGQVKPRYTEQYRFRADTDDGARLWVNGQLLIDAVNKLSGNRTSALISLNAGVKYDIILEFTENTLAASATLYWSSFSQTEEVIPTSQLYPSVLPTPTPIDTAVNGLYGQYFDNSDFSDLKLSRVDTAIDYSWVFDSPDPSVGPDTFSIRWTGQVQPLYNEQYTFRADVDDVARVWLNNQLIIAGSFPFISSPISLTAGQKYDITVEFIEYGGVANVVLYWSSASQPLQVIPPPLLYPLTPTPTLTPTATVTPTSTLTQTPTSTDTPTVTPTVTPTHTSTFTATESPSATATPSFTPTVTDTATEPPTPTSTATSTGMPTHMPTSAPTQTPIRRDTPTITATPTPTITGTSLPDFPIDRRLPRPRLTVRRTASRGSQAYARCQVSTQRLPRVINYVFTVRSSGTFGTVTDTFTTTHRRGILRFTRRRDDRVDRYAQYRVFCLYPCQRLSIALQ